MSDEPLTEKEISDHADELLAIVAKVIEAALRTSKHPAWALTGLHVAAQIYQAACVADAVLDEETIANMLAFSKDVVHSDSGPDPLMLTLVRQEILRRRVVADVPPKVIQQGIEAAGEALQIARDRTKHPAAVVLVLSIAKEMALAILKHDKKDDLDRELTDLRSMENAYKLDEIHVTKVPPMSKGGDA